MSVDYAKAPRHPYPHALLQLTETLIWATTCPELPAIIGFAIEPSRVVVMGNSAGGNLVTALTLLTSFTSGPCSIFRSRLPKSFRLAGQILLYPSLACDRPYLDRYNSAEEAVRAASLPVWAASLMEASYLPPYIEKNQIFIAPVNSSVDLLQSLQLPPTLCVKAGQDCLKLEAEEYVGKLRSANAKLLMLDFPTATHGFSHHRTDYEEERTQCWEQVHTFLKECFCIEDGHDGVRPI